METDLTALHQKIDLLTGQVSYLTEQLEAQHNRQLEMVELRKDFMPIANDMVRIAIDELADIGNDFQAEDLLFLLKRVLRNTNNFITMLDRLEGVMGLADETKLLGHQVFDTTVETLAELEQKGYFDLLRGLGYITERIVDEFGEDDVRALGDNIVTILTTVKNMTQPEVLSIANQAVEAIQDQPSDQEITTWGLIREFSDPKVRKGMARMLNLVKAMADQPTINLKN
jgi:uncharacterized protein YjgD (DUF1641 family)